MIGKSDRDPGAATTPRDLAVMSADGVAACVLPVRPGIAAHR